MSGGAVARNLILTGVPRSGTTLCCSLMNRAADTVALVEPMPVHALPLDHAEAGAEVRRFFARSRAGLLSAGEAVGQQLDGRGTDNFFDDERDGRGLRVRKAQLGHLRVDRPLSAAFTLVVKHNAAFAALLPVLAESFECLALVRNPLAVLASWNSVDLPVARGRLPAGERLVPALAAALDAQPDLLNRQLLLLDWLFDGFVRALPRARILRYEDVVESGGAALAHASGVPVPTSALASRNASRLYDAAACKRFAERLHADAGAWRGFYGDDDIVRALAALAEPA